LYHLKDINQQLHSEEDQAVVTLIVLVMSGYKDLLEPQENHSSGMFSSHKLEKIS
jgi:hypothetical protein